MKRFLLITAVAVLCICCGAPKQEDPVCEAIKAEVAGQLGELRSFTWDSIEQVGTSSFGDEIARRRNTIEVRRKQNLKLAAKYKAEGKSNNAAKKEAEAAHDAKVLEGIDALEARLAKADSLDATELVIYRFSARAKASDGTSSHIKDMYIALTPQNEVAAMDYSREKLFKATGRLLPGYRELFED